MPVPTHLVTALLPAKSDRPGHQLEWPGTALVKPVELDWSTQNLKLWY